MTPRTLTREQYRAARRRIHKLNDWLGTHRRPYTTGCDPNAEAAERYDRLRAERDRLVSITRPPWDANGWRVFAENQARRRSHVLFRVEQRRRERAAAALDTRGMTPLQAAFARIQTSWAA